MNERGIFELLYQSKIVKSCGFENFGSMYGAYACYSTQNALQRTANAVSRDNPVDAMAKASIEAYERYCCEQSRFDVVAAADDFNNRESKLYGQAWVNPNEYVPFTRTQARLSRLMPFSEQDLICWCKGYSLSEKINDDKSMQTIYVPQDMVYYNEGKAFYRANSSGVAAHACKDSAIENAIAELIERDAIMRAHLSRKYAMSIPEKLLPGNIYVQKKRLEVSDYTHKTIHMICLPGFIPTALVVITSYLYPYIATGAAASFVSFEKALEKALEEAEYNYYCYSKNETKYAILPKRLVFTPEDHGFYYAKNKHADISWLWSKGELDSLPAITKTISDAASELDIIIVSLAKPLSGNTIPLHVVRALSRQLIPISFGYGMIHYSHPSIGFNISAEAKKELHFFA